MPTLKLQPSCHRNLAKFFRCLIGVYQFTPTGSSDFLTAISLSRRRLRRAREVEAASQQRTASPVSSVPTGFTGNCASRTPLEIVQLDHEAIPAGFDAVRQFGAKLSVIEALVHMGQHGTPRPHPSDPRQRLCEV